MKNKWEDRGDHIVIFANGEGERHEILIDKPDFEKVAAYSGTWYVRAGGGTHGAVINARDANGKRNLVQMDRMLMNLPGETEVSGPIQELVGQFVEMTMITSSSASRNSRHFSVAEVEMDWDMGVLSLLPREESDGEPEASAISFRGVIGVCPREDGGMLVEGEDEQGAWTVVIQILGIIEQVDVAFTEDRRVVAKFLESLSGKEVFMWRSTLPFCGENVTLREFFIVKSARLIDRIFSITPHGGKAVLVRDIESARVDEEMSTLILNGGSGSGTAWEAQVVLQDRE